MSTSLWPALLAAVLGGGGSNGGSNNGRIGLEEDGERASVHPIQALLYLSVLGEHALYWWIGIVCFVGLAYATNPSEASFKTHLTDLSFHLHLRRLRGAHDRDNNDSSNTLPGDFRRSSSSTASSLNGSSTSLAAVNAAGPAKINNQSSASTGKSSKNALNNGSNGASTPSSNGQQNGTESKARSVSIKSTHPNGDHHHFSSGRASHVLSFSNRVSISLKTPAYVRTSYGLWSTVRILPASSSTSNSSSSSSSNGTSVKTGNKGSNAGIAAGTTGRPILNGVPAMTRRSSTTLPSMHDKSSTKKASSTATSSSSSTSTKTKKGGLVSSVTNGITASLSSTPVCSPWLEQGGYFIGFLGYWWTVDDGTSFSGAREKARLGKALTAVVEEVEVGDEEDNVSVDQVGPESSRHADDLEGGHVYYDNLHSQSSNSTRTDDQSTTSNVQMNGNTSNSNANASNSNKRKQHPSKASTSASMRGGQRRSSPTPRQISTKKRGSGSNALGSNASTAQVSQGNSSGDVTPVTPNSVSGGVPLDRSRLDREGAAGHLLSTNDDSTLPGLPFHVDRSKDVTSGGNASQDRQFVTEGTEVVGTDGQVKLFIAKEGEDGLLSTISHTASAPDSTVSTVSPALALLQSQLDDLRTTSITTQAKLESEIEELQIRKRDEDAVRIELKARTKILEENKREAESERLDAEKKLIAARSVKKGVEDRVTKARSELSKLEKKEREVQEKIVRSREERRNKLDALREDVKKREALLIKEEEATEKLTKRVADLEKEIEERKHDLFQFRREEANAAAQAVTNRMNRAGRGLGPHPHTHGHGPHSGAAQTAKRHMHPSSSAVGGHNASLGGGPPPPSSHRHPSQHPNAAVPIAYPYISPEDQAKQQSSTGGNANAARSSSPVGGGNGSQVPTTQNTAHVETGQNFGSTFMDHRMQSRRAASAAGSIGQQAAPSVALGGNQPVSSSVNTSVIGNSASAASALYNRQQLDRDDNDDAFDVEEDDGAVKNLIPGSTFAPFGPASPTSPSTIGAPSPREQHARITNGSGGSPAAVGHLPPYFASDKAHQNRLRLSNSRENFLASMRSEVVEDDDHNNTGDLDTTPIMGLPRDLAVDDTDSHSYALAKPRAIAGGDRMRGHTGGLRRESFDSVGSFTSSNGGPLSPMTPHQASLIPSQLFDMLDDVEMPASPTPYQVASGMHPRHDPHHTFTQGISDAFDSATNTDVDTGSTLQPQHDTARRAPSYSPWADFDIDSGFDFDKPLGGHVHGHSVSAGVSRKASGREAPGLAHAHHADLLRRRSGSPGAFDTASTGAGSTTTAGEGIFASHGPSHGHHGSTGSAGGAGGQRSNTSSSGGSISPSLAAAAQAQQQGMSTNTNSILPPGFGKLSPNDLLFDKARHVLSLNPDAKAFNFNRPLPSSGSAGSLSSIGGGASSAKNGGGLPSNAVVGAIGDARYAFDSAGVGESPNLINGSIISSTAGNTTWASPNLTSRGLVHNLGYGTAAGHHAHGTVGNGTLRESTRSSSGPPSISHSGGTTTSTGSSFSPFDDDDLLKGW